MITATPGKRARLNLTFQKFDKVYLEGWKLASSKEEKSTVIEGLRDDLFKARVERWTQRVSKKGFEALKNNSVKSLTSEHPITINSLVRHLLNLNTRLTQEEFESIVDEANIVNYTLSTENDILRDTDNKFSFEERKSGWEDIYKSHDIELIDLPAKSMTVSGTFSKKYKKELGL